MWFPPNRRPYRRFTLWRTRQMLHRQASRHRHQEHLRCSRQCRQDLRQRRPRQSRCFQSFLQRCATHALCPGAWKLARSSARRHLRRSLPRVRARREHLPMWFAPCRRRRVRPRQRSARLISTLCSSRREAPSAGRLRTQPTTARLLRPARQCHMRRRPRARQRQPLLREEQAALPFSIRKRDMPRRHRALVQPLRGAQCLWPIARCQRPQLNR